MVHNCWWYRECNKKNVKNLMPWYFQTVTWVVWLNTYHASYEVDLHSIMDPAFACRGSAEPSSRFFWSADASVTFVTHWFCFLWRWCLILRVSVSEFKPCCSTDVFIHSNQFAYWCLPRSVLGQVFIFSDERYYWSEDKPNWVCNESLSTATTCLARLINFFLIHYFL